MSPPNQAHAGTDASVSRAGIGVRVTASSTMSPSCQRGN
jgi:hypothetical protein